MQSLFKHTYTHEVKFLSCHAHLVIQDTCVLNRHIMPVRCNLLEPGQGARRSTDCTSHCRCGHPVVPPVPLVVSEAQPVHFAPQYKTRYRLVLFYRWVGWRYYFEIPSCPGVEPVSSGLWAQDFTSRTSGHTHTNTLTHTHTHSLTRTHSPS